MARKVIPREVLEERLRVYEETQARRRMFMVQFGVYFVNLLGVMASQAIDLAQDLSAALSPMELSQVAGAAIVSTLVYSKTHTDKADLAGMAKQGNLFRVLMTAFSNGFMWQTMIGAWW